MDNTRLLLVFLIELIIYFLVWQWNNFIASYVTLIFAAISFFVLIISVISDRIERSNIASWYYKFMVINILAPIISVLLYLVTGGEFTWAKG
ncbi:MAG: hypothetical protein KA974_05045 [Saprospiraceae bacterium]|nr:hypothetical protein [Saprospiraceae bacterium]MBP7699769.1 hypothetical protein [Saprospiraceae bacterium]